MNPDHLQLIPEAPYQPPERKPSTFAKILPWVLIPVAFLLGVGAGGAGEDSDSKEPEDSATTIEETSSPAEIQTQAAEQPEAEELGAEILFLEFLSMDMVSPTVNVGEDAEELTALGYRICGWAGEEDATLEWLIIQVFADDNELGLDETGMGNVIGAAVTGLCPEHAALVNA